MSSCLQDSTKDRQKNPNKTKRSFSSPKSVSCFGENANEELSRLVGPISGSNDDIVTRIQTQLPPDAPVEESWFQIQNQEAFYEQFRVWCKNLKSARISLKEQQMFRERSSENFKKLLAVSSFFFLLMQANDLYFKLFRLLFF